MYKQGETGGGLKNSNLALPEGDNGDGDDDDDDEDEDDDGKKVRELTI